MSLPPPRDHGLDSELAALARELAWPPTPPIAAAVGAALVAAPPGRRRLRASWRPARRALVLGLLAALLVIGAVAGIGFALGGLKIVFGGPSPGSPLPPRVVAERGFGQRTDLGTATARLGGLLVPTDSALGAPDHVYFDARTQAVALAWGARPGFPTDPESGLGVVVTEFRADITPGTFTKVLDEGAVLQQTSVAGKRAYWVAGGQHFLYFIGPNGEPLQSTIRMVGSTLMWEDAGLTVRVEGVANLADAVRLAASMERRSAP